MSNDTVSLDVLQWFTPLNGLKPENLNALAKKTQVKRLTAGKLLFRENDREKLTIYLVSGSLELSDKEGNKKILESGTDEARSPITPILPRRYNAKAINEVEFMAIDTDLIDVMLTWDQTGDYEVSELQDTFEMTTADWMTSMLGTKAFHRIPASNIQAIFMRMQQVNFNAGDVVVQQGDAGDFFYVITKGRCTVTRETPLNPDGIKLAELKPGDTFGEESLISDALRNATVSMMTDGAVMRLGKDDFKTLLNEPMVDWVEYEEAKKIVEDGGQWLDPERAIAHAGELARDGADVIELGPASSHPDAEAVAAAVQIRRLAPVIDALSDAGAPLGLDATDPEVLRFGLSRGLAWLNDVRGFPDPALYPDLAGSDCSLVVMHSVLGADRASRRAGLAPGRVVEAVERFFAARLAALVRGGIAETRIVLDPGMGFFLGPDPRTSFRVLDALPLLRERFGRPLLVSVSRKSFLRVVSGRRLEEIGAATLAAEVFAVLQGTDHLRTHDVRALADARAVLAALGAAIPGAAALRSPPPD